ncbi:hypothetical protein AB0M61_27660 [Streptomyces sp. NPDC051642]|uniref:hypothetical protein n=1 Tax=Streptomyces sp. NPDC051642 TaxID=3154646 RepID=UPI003443E735
MSIRRSSTRCGETKWVGFAHKTCGNGLTSRWSWRRCDVDDVVRDTTLCALYGCLEEPERFRSWPVAIAVRHGAVG